VGKYKDSDSLDKLKTYRVGVSSKVDKEFKAEILDNLIIYRVGEYYGVDDLGELKACLVGIFFKAENSDELDGRRIGESSSSILARLALILVKEEDIVLR